MVEVRVYNTDSEMIKCLTDWLDAKGITYITLVQKDKKRRPGYIVKVSNRKSSSAFLETILPFLVGKKREVAKLALSYFDIPRRMLGRFRFGKWQQIIEIAERINALNDKASVHAIKHKQHLDSIKVHLENKRVVWERQHSKPCLRCGRIFSGWPTQVSRQKYCSVSCKNLALSEIAISPNPEVLTVIAK